MRSIWSFSLSVFGTLAVLALGAWFGGHPSALPAPLRDVLVDDEVATFAEVIDRVDDGYYRDVDRAPLTDAAVRGLVGSLDDRFSAYFTPSEYGRYRDATNSQFSGIGVAVQPVKAGLEIARVYPKSPAREAGLRPNDVIVSAAGKRLAGRPENASTALIRGPEGTTVRLSIARGRKEFRRVVPRAQIKVPVVARRTVKTKRGWVSVVTLGGFTSGAHAELYGALKRAKADTPKGVVLDLRGNPGGLVSEARLVASAFLADGVIVRTGGRTVEAQTLRATGKPVVPDLPTVVLVNKQSASAAEIVAGALQDRKRAKLVGQRTFGKGVFQEVSPLRNGGALDITVGQYFTPSGRNLGGKGVASGRGLGPDVVVADDRKTKRDEQLDRAAAELTRAK